MNIKVSTKYQINEYIKSIKVFYLVVVLVMVFFGVLIAINSPSDFTSNGGIEGSAMVFLFVLGLNSFKETFLMMLQNGVTRKSMFIGRLLTILATSAFMALVDRFLVNIAGLFNNISERFYISGMYEELFTERSESLHIVVRNLEAILIAFFVYAAAMVAGYFITTAYYRMSKALKTAVSIGVPATILIILPILDTTVFEGKIVRVIGKFLEFAFGASPYNLILTCAIFFIIAAGLTWLLVRKAVEKK